MCYLLPVFNVSKEWTSFSFEGAGGSRKNHHKFPFFGDVELVDQSVIYLDQGVTMINVIWVGSLKSNILFWWNSPKIIKIVAPFHFRPLLPPSLGLHITVCVYKVWFIAAFLDKMLNVIWYNFLDNSDNSAKHVFR